jgi:hypothetical protein
MLNPTTRTYPRTLAQAFPRHPEAHFEDDSGWDGHRVLECALIVLLVVLPVFFWLVAP